MSLVTVKDRADTRWTKLDSLYLSITGIDVITRNASRDLQHLVSEQNVREYQNLDLSEDQRVEREHAKSKYVNDNGVLEYCDKTSGVKSLILDVLNQLHLPPIQYNIIISTESLAFYEDSFNFDDVFVTIRIVDKNQVWIEGLKICELFGYANARQAIGNHVSEENKRKLHQFTDSPYASYVQDNSEVTRGLSRDLILINKTAIWELSQHSKKPILKNFWARMCKILSNRYSIKFDPKNEEILAFPSQPTATTGEESMDVDVVNSVPYLRLQLELEREKREKAEYREQTQIQLEKLNTSVIVSKCEAEVIKTKYLFQMKFSDAIDVAHLVTLNENRALREERKKLDQKLRGPSYSVTQSIADVNPGKENVIAFIWDRVSNTYRAVRQIRESFDDTFKFVLQSRDSGEEPRHRVNGTPPRRKNEARHVIIGLEFKSNNAHNEWNRFKHEHFEIVFGLKFVTHSLMEFCILSADQLREKYEQFKEIDDQDLLTNSSEPRSKRIIMQNDLSVFRKLELQNGDDCVRRCLVPHIWYMFDLLKAQMERDNLTNAQTDVDADMGECRTRFNSETDEMVTANERKYGALEQYGCLQPIEIKRFARMETMSLVDDNADNADRYNRCLSRVRGILNSDECGGGTIESAIQQAPSTSSQQSSSPSQIDRFLHDLERKRQIKPTTQ